MHIVVCGVSHKTAPIEMLERVAFGPDSHEAVLSQLTQGDNGDQPPVMEAVLLSTCNRVELYAVVTDETGGAGPIIEFLANFHHMPVPVLQAHVYEHQGQEAVVHLCNVAAGLDSMILGEPQILGQVRTAFEKASALGAAGPILSTLFRHAIETGKRVRSETSISQRAASVSYAAVELAFQHFGDLHDRQVLIVGAGKTGQLTARCLLGRCANQVMVANRNFDRAQALAQQWNGRALSLDDLEDALRQADIVISATDAPDYLITAEQVRHAMAVREARPLLLIDIAVPRDIEPAAGDIAGVRLADMDDLDNLVERNLQDRTRDREAAEGIVEEEVTKFMCWLNALAVTPTIVNLRQYAESIRLQELERARRRLGDLSKRDLEVIEMLTQRIVNQLLHEPTVRLKQYAGCDDRSMYVQALSDLFALDEMQVGNQP